MVFGFYENIFGAYYNVCDNEMRGIRDFVERKAQEMQEAKDTNFEHKINSLTEHQKKIDLCSKEIEGKYSLLEKNMEHLLKASIGLKGE